MGKTKRRIRNIEILIIVIALMLGIIGIFSYDYYENNFKKDNSNLNEKLPQEHLPLTRQSAEVKELYTWVTDCGACAEGYFWALADYPQLANGEAITGETMIKTDQQTLMFKQLELAKLIPSPDNIKEKDVVLKIPSAKVDEAIEKIFGSAITFDKTAIKNAFYHGYNFNYNSQDDTLVGEWAPYGCEGSTPGETSVLLAVEESKSALHLIIQVYEIKVDELGIETKDGVDFFVYDYTFKKGLDNQYYFSSVAYNF